MKRNPNQTNGFLLLTADEEKVTIYGVKGINKPRLLYQSSNYSIKVQLYQELPSPRIWPYKYFLPLT